MNNKNVRVFAINHDKEEVEEHTNIWLEYLNAQQELIRQLTAPISSSIYDVFKENDVFENSGDPGGCYF